MRTANRGMWGRGIGVLATLVALLGITLLTVPSAGAGTRLKGPAKPVLELATSSLTRGKGASLDVNALSNRVCALSFQGPGRRHAGPYFVRVRRPHVRWTWRVSRTAARGHWTARVACAGSRSSVRHGRAGTLAQSMTLSARRGGRGSIVAARSMHVRTSRSAPGGRAAASGGKVVAGLGSGHNPFPYGQCTYHAYETRPDVYDYAVAHGVPAGGPATGASLGGIPDYWWNAWRWLSNAQRVGIPTGTTPVPGALVVFPRGYGGSPVGHIAYVERVNPNGSYVVSERNWNYNPNITERLVYPGYPGVGFIYGGPAGNGPVPPPPPPHITTTTTTTTIGSHTTTGAKPPYYVHHVQGTCADGGCGLHERTGPGYSNYSIVHTYSDGQTIDIVCQTTGQYVQPNHGTGSDVWDRLTNGGYVTDVYVDTSGVGGAFSPPIPRC